MSPGPTYPAGSAAVAQAEGRPPLIGKARGLAAGTLLACGSVLAVAVHAADSSGQAQAAPPKLVTVDPDGVSGGHAAAPVVSGSAAPPAVTRAQSLGGPQVRAGAVPRNVPQAIDVPRAVSAQPQQQAPLRMPGADRGQQAPDRGPVERTIAPVTGPVTEAPETVVDAVGDLIAPKGRSLSSTASVVERVAPAAGALLEQAAPAGQAPVEEVLTPLQNVAGQVPDVAGPLRDVAAPLDDGAQPALTMLSSLPLG